MNFVSAWRRGSKTCNREDAGCLPEAKFNMQSSSVLCTAVHQLKCVSFNAYFDTVQDCRCHPTKSKRIRLALLISVTRLNMSHYSPLCVR